MSLKKGFIFSLFFVFALFATPNFDTHQTSLVTFASDAAAQDTISKAKNLLGSPTFLELIADPKWSVFKRAVAAITGSLLGPAEERYESLSTCWACPLFDAVSIISEEIAVRGFFLSNVSAGNLLKAMLAIWLVIQVSKILLPFGPAGQVSSVFNDIFVKIALSIMAFGLLTSGSGMNASINYESGRAKTGKQISYNDLTFTAYTAVPMLKISLDWSKRIILLGDSVGMIYLTNIADNFDSDVNSGQEFMKAFRFEILKDPTQDASKKNAHGEYCGSNVNPYGGNSKVVSQEIRDGINCRLAGIQRLLATGLTIGIYALLQPGEATSFWEFWVKDVFSGIFPTVLSQMVAGFLLIFIYGLAMLGFPFLMVEVFFRIAIASLIAPLAIALAVFKPFRQPLRLVIRMILHGALAILFVGIAVALSASLIRAAITMTVIEYDQEAANYFVRIKGPIKIRGNTELRTDVTEAYENQQCKPAKAISDEEKESFLVGSPKDDKGDVITDPTQTAKYKAIVQCYKSISNIADELCEATGYTSASAGGTSVPKCDKLKMSLIKTPGDLMKAIDGTLLYSLGNTTIQSSIAKEQQTSGNVGSEELSDQDFELFGLNVGGGLGDRLRGHISSMLEENPQIVGNFMYRMAIHKPSFWALFFASALLFFLLQKADAMAGQFAESQFSTGAGQAVAGATTAIASGVAMKAAGVAQRRWTMLHSQISNSTPKPNQNP